MTSVSRAVFVLVTLIAAPAPSLALAQALSNEQLEAHRGGFLSAAGLTIGFGAVTRTFIDGSLALETHLTWTGQGPQTTQTAGAGGDALGAEALSSLAAAGIRAPDLGQSAYVSADGRSAVIQKVGSDFLANVLLNTADSRSVSQNTELTLTLPGFQAEQARLNQAAAASNLAQELTAAALLGLR